MLRTSPRISTVLNTLAAIAAILPAALAAAAPPPLRDQVLLNGTWAEGDAVPVYLGETFETKTYRRQVQAPAAWAGKQIRLEFQQVNYIADVYVDGRHVANHVGGWIPFSVDLTKLIQPGKEFSLEVRVKSSTQEP